MFAAYCPQHGKTVLLGLSDIVAVSNTDDDIVVEWECFCGERGHTHTGHTHTGHTHTGHTHTGPTAGQSVTPSRWPSRSSYAACLSSADRRGRSPAA